MQPISLQHCLSEVTTVLAGHRASDTSVLDQLRWNLPQFHGQNDEQIGRADLSESDAQRVVARWHYLTDWPTLLAFIAQLERGTPEVLHFERAADAIMTGDIDTLRALLTMDPALVRARSLRSHRSTLLHYTAANGIENYRQRTPPNVLDIARLLLDTGADVNATSDAYGGGSTTLGLASTSTHPRTRGVQIALIDVLLEAGAALDGADTLPSLVSGALANGCPEAARALAQRGAKVNTLYAAAGLADLPKVAALYPQATGEQRDAAMILAAQQGHRDVLIWLLDQGVNVNASDGMTALHQASGGGHREIMRILLDRGADLEKENMFGGTVLSSTLWFAYHVQDAEFVTADYPRTLSMLIDAGARTDVYPGLMADIEWVHQRARTIVAQ